MTFFASKQIEENVARLIESYRTTTRERGTVPIDPFPAEEIHDCVKRGCVYVLKTEEADSEAVVRSGLVRTPVGPKTLLVRQPLGDVVRESERGHRSVGGLRRLRAELHPGVRLVMWPKDAA